MSHDPWEVWLPAPGAFAGRYEVSNRLRVRSISREAPKRAAAGRVITFRVRGRVLTTRTFPRSGRVVVQVTAGDASTGCRGRQVLADVRRWAEEVFG